MGKNNCDLKLAKQNVIVVFEGIMFSINPSVDP